MSKLHGWSGGWDNYLGCFERDVAVMLIFKVSSVKQSAISFSIWAVFFLSFSAANLSINNVSFMGGRGE